MAADGSTAARRGRRAARAGGAVEWADPRPHFQANPRVRLVAVVDAWREGAGSPAARRREVLHVLEDAIADTRASAVWISTPTDAHEEAIRVAAAAGLPVFTEKPVAEDPESIARVFGIAREAGVALCCGFQRRFDKSYVACLYLSLCVFAVSLTVI